MSENIRYIYVTKLTLTASTTAKVTSMPCLTLTDVNFCACLVLGCNKLGPKYREPEKRFYVFLADAVYTVSDSELTPH